MRIEIPQLKITCEKVPVGVNLLAYLSGQGIQVARSCGGDGVCGTCRLQITGEGIPKISKSEERLALKQKCPVGERFACLIQVPDRDAELLEQSSNTWVLRCDYW